VSSLASFNRKVVLFLATKPLTAPILILSG
jgi:hypothetical protein